jgi:thiamine biosynthesis lipoprotein
MTDPTSWQLSPSALPPESRLTHVELVMGTAVTFDVRFDGERVRAAAEAAVAEACEWLHWVDTTFTTYDESSYVRRLARGEVAVGDCPAQVGEVVEMCERYRDETDGWFDPWAGPVGFDPSGLVKGWSVQLASDRLVSRGFTRHCVNGGGDVAARGRPSGAPSWGVGIVDPFDNASLVVAVRVVDEAVATSGVAERGRHVWRRDGTPATELASVTVLDPDLIRADVLATSALAMGQGALAWLAERVRDAYVIDARRSERMTAGFADRCERLTAS